MLKIPKSECPDPNHGQTLKIPWYFLNDIYMVTHCWIVHGKTIRRSFVRTWTGESTELGMYVRSSRTRVIFVSFFGDDIKMAGKKYNMAPRWKHNEKMWILTNPHRFLTMCTWDVLSVDANRMKQLLNNTRRCVNHVFLLEQRKNYRDGKTSSANCSVVRRHGGTCSKMRHAIV